MDQISDATIAEIEDELAGDGVWIDPAFARNNDISASDEARIEEAVASAERSDLEVVLVEVDIQDERFQGSFSSLTAWLQDSTGGRDTTYVGWQDYSEPALQVDAYGDQPDTTYVDNVAAHEHPDDFVDQVVRVQELLDDGNADALWDEVPDDEKYSWTADEGVQASEVVGGLGIVVAVAALVAGARGGAVGGAAPAPRASLLPATVLHTVRAAEDRRLRQQAGRRGCSRWGEAIGRGEPTIADALAAWQQALSTTTPSARPRSCRRTRHRPTWWARSSWPAGARTPARARGASIVGLGAGGPLLVQPAARRPHDDRHVAGGVAGRATRGRRTRVPRLRGRRARRTRAGRRPRLHRGRPDRALLPARPRPVESHRLRHARARPAGRPAFEREGRAARTGEPGPPRHGWLNRAMAHLDLSANVVTLTQQLVDIFSVSHEEEEIADAVESALRGLPHLTVTRRGHTIVARTELGRGERVHHRRSHRHRAAQRQPALASRGRGPARPRQL